MSTTVTMAPKDDPAMDTSSNTSKMSALSVCWKRRTCSEKMLLILTLVVFVAFIIAIAVLVDVYHRLELKNRPKPVTDDASILCTTHLQPSQASTSSMDIETNIIPSPKYCLTPQCIETASRVLTSIDTAANPCEDMEHFACGGWKMRLMNSPDRPQVAMTLDSLQTKIDHQLRMILEGPPHPQELKAYQKVRHYFRSCMSDNQEKERKSSLQRVLTSLGGIIHPSNWSEFSFDITQFLSEIANLNGAPFFDIAVQVDDRDPKKFALAVGLPRSSGIMPQFYSKLPDLKRYESILSRKKRQAVDIGDIGIDGATDELPTVPELNNLLTILRNADDAPLNETNLGAATLLHAMQIANKDQKTTTTFELFNEAGFFKDFDLVEKEVEMQQMRMVIHMIDTLAPLERERKIKQQTNQILNYFTIAELQKDFDFVDWRRLLNQVVGAELAPETEVLVHFPDVLRKISNIFKSVIDKRIVRNALLVLFARDIGLELVQMPQGTDKWQFCMQAAKGGFGEILSSMYLSQFPPSRLQFYQEKGDELFTVLKESIVESIKEVDWLDSESRLRALRKAEKLRSNFVASPVFFNKTYLEESVQEVLVENADFVEATFNLYNIFRKDFFELYSEPVDESLVTWQLLAYPMVANAFYLQHFNSMVMPLALLNDPMFSVELPKYLTLGTLGFIMAHEIMHGFDRAGVEFDDGGMRNPWLNPDSSQRFLEKQQCVSRQYAETFKTTIAHNGTNVVLQVDGELTLNENIADLGAIKAISRTRTKFEHKFGREMDLPGLNYTHEQLMYIHAAQAYCSLLTPPTYALILGIDEHTPHPDRVNGFLMNHPGFAEAFQCPLGSRMNPKQKCSPW